MTKVLYVVISLVVVLVAAVLIAPSFVDWNSYKPEIAAAVHDATGRKLRIDGDIELSVFPAPALKVGKVGLANIDGAESNDMMTLDEVRIRIDIGALLGGKIAVSSVRLVRPKIALEVTQDGRASWDIEPTDRSGITSGTVSGETTTRGGGEALAVSLESLKIEDAVITYRDARSGATERIDALSADIAADSLSGPFRIEGGAKVRGLPLTFDASAGRTDTGRPIPLRLALGLKDTDASAVFVGQLSGLVPEAHLTGTLKLDAEDTAAAVSAAAGATLPEPLAKPLAIEGDINASVKSVAANKLTIRLGDTSLSGAVHALLDGPTPKIDILMTASRIDLDGLLAATGDTGPRTDAGPAPSGGSVNPGPSAKTEAPGVGFALPSDVTVAFDLTAEAAAFRGGAIRDIAVKGELADGILTVSRIAALLPGSADFTLSGALRAVDGQPQFDGDLAATADNFRGMVEWLGIDPAALPADRLRSFSYTSNVSGTPSSVQLTNIAAQLDTSRITGGLVAELREKPGIGLRLSVDRFNLDAYLPRQAAVTTPAAAQESAPAAGSSKQAAPAGQKGPGLLAGFPVPTAIGDALDAVDANIDLRADQLSFQGETLRNVRLDLTLFDDKVTVREASVADFAGLAASASAVLSNVRTSPRLGLDYVAEVRDAPRLFRYLGSTAPVSAARLGTLGASGRVDVATESLTTKSALRGMGADLTVDGTVQGLPAVTGVDLKVAANHPELATLARSFVPDYRPAASKLGPLAMSFRVTGTPKAFEVREIGGKAGPVAIEGGITATLDSAPMKFDVDLRTSEILADLFQPAAGGGQGAPTPRTAGRSSGAGGNAPSSQAGRWSTTPIGLPLIPGIDVDATLEMAALTAGDIRLDSAKLQARLQGGKFTVDSLTARLFEGTLSSRATVEPQGNTAAVAFDLQLDNIASRTAVKALTGHDRVEGPISLKASFNTRGVSEAALVSALDGTASVSGQMRVLLTQDERNTVGAASTGGALLSALLGSKVRELQRLAPITQLMVSLDQAFGRNPAQLSGDVKVTDGVASTENLKVVGAGSTALTRATANLPRWDFTSRTELVDDPKLEPAVTFEASGPIDAPARTRIGGRILKGGAPGAQDGKTEAPHKALPSIFDGLRPVPPQGQQQQQKTTPQDLFKGILKNLQH